MHSTELDRKLFKNIPPNCPSPAEGQVTFHDYMAEHIADSWLLIDKMVWYVDIVDLHILGYEKTRLPEEQGIFRFPDPEETIVQKTEKGHIHLTDAFYLDGYFKEMDMLWQSINSDMKDKPSLLPGIRSQLDQMDANEEAVRDTVGGKFLSLLGSLGLAVLCALAAFGLYKLIGISASWGRGAGFLFGLLIGTIPLLSWALMIAGGIGAVGLLLYSLIQLLQLLGLIFSTGKRRKRRKAYWQAYRDALRYVRLRQLFYQHLTGKENKTFRDLQRLVEKKAAPYPNKVKW
ncbi:MAG: hypothetical protein E7319_01860 [Clostridiales bacterium]|nr:hypothetical protein [Clostridiales bacterium]